MNYRSLADLNDALVANLHRLPRDVDLIVGIPRSGLLAANVLSLVTNLPLTDLDSFVEGRLYSSGTTKNTSRLTIDIEDARRILVLDDSINTGEALDRARARIEAAGLQSKCLFGAVYGAKAVHEEADIVFERVKHPRMFQWNFMHHGNLERACVEIDGVLALARSAGSSDPLPLHKTTRRIGRLVTSRPESERGATESWLERQGIAYGDLVMFGRSSDPRAYANAKGEFYGSIDATLFIEGHEDQAEVVARLSGKPVLSVEAHRVHMPLPLSSMAVRHRVRTLPTRLKESGNDTIARCKSAGRVVLGKRGYSTLKKLFGSQPRA